MKRICPVCGESYQTVLEPDLSSRLLIQEQYPDAEPWQREQVISGICSDSCWSRWFDDSV